MVTNLVFFLGLAIIVSSDDMSSIDGHSKYAAPKIAVLAHDAQNILDWEESVYSFYARLRAPELLISEFNQSKSYHDLMLESIASNSVSSVSSPSEQMCSHPSNTRH